MSATPSPPPLHLQHISTVRDWLMARRGQLEVNARTLGLPMTVVVPVQTAEFVESGGVSIQTEQRPMSLLAVTGFTDPRMHMRLATPMLDSDGEAIGQELAGAYGDGIKFLSHLAPGGLLHDMTQPELLQVTDSPAHATSIEEHMLRWEPLFYALYLLRQCLMEYVSFIPSLDCDDAVLAHRLATELVSFCKSSDQTYLARVPLAGIDIHGDTAGVHSCSLMRLSRDELGFLYSQRDVPWRLTPHGRSLPGSFDQSRFIMETVVLELRAQHRKTQWYDMGALTQRVLLALHLLGVEYAGASYGAMLQEPLWIQSSGQSIYPLLMPPRPPSAPTSVDTDKISAAVALAEKIPDAAIANPSSPSELALSRVCFGMSKANPRDSLVDYVVALEAVLLSGGDIGEAKRRFALNGAVYGASTKEERRRVYQALKDIYGARSILVHGVDPTEHRVRKLLPNVQAIKDAACAIARDILVRALEHGWPTEDDFDSALLDDASG